MVRIGDEEAPIWRERHSAPVVVVGLNEVERGGACRLPRVGHGTVGVQDDESTARGVGDPDSAIGRGVHVERRRHPELIGGPGPDLMKRRD